MHGQVTRRKLRKYLTRPVQHEGYLREVSHPIIFPPSPGTKKIVFRELEFL